MIFETKPLITDNKKMYDITLCSGGECPFKAYCFRNTAEVLGRQDFFGTVPYHYSTKTCEYFYENKAFKEKRQLKAYQIWQEKGCPEGEDKQHWHKAKEALLTEAVQRKS